MRFLAPLVALAASSALVAAAPVPNTQKDPPYSVPLETIHDAVTCPRGIQGRKGGVVLLVHGTGSTGPESWQNGPYTEILPDLEPGFDVCWVTLPNRSTSDIQVSSEYVAGNIEKLAQQSATKKISLIGHSQGTINIQWALTFWPSLRKHVEDYVSLAGDYHGSANFPFCPLQLCTQALWQQYYTSKFITALRVHGATALVDTTNVITRTDEIVQPQVGPAVSGFLEGDATHFAVNDLNVCGPTHVAEHFTMVIDSAAFGLAYTALSKPGPAQSFDEPLDCIQYRKQDTIPSTLTVVKDLPPSVVSIAADLLGNVLLPKEPAEAKLMQYVCDSGSAPQEQCE